MSKREKGSRLPSRQPKESVRQTNAGLKASKVSGALADIMPNIGGPKQPRRFLLSSVVYSVILYGVPI